MIQELDKTKESTPKGNNIIQNVIIRATVMLPPAVAWFISITNLYLYYVLGLSLLPFVEPIQVVSSVLLIIVTLIIHWSDYKRQKNNSL